MDPLVIIIIIFLIKKIQFDTAIGEGGHVMNLTSSRTFERSLRVCILIKMFISIYMYFN